MTSLHLSLAEDIYNTPDFQKAYNDLQVLSFQHKIQNISPANQPEAVLDREKLSKLLESAFCFSSLSIEEINDSDAHINKYLDAAYRIATQIYSLFPSFGEGNKEAVYIILSRLGNYKSAEKLLGGQEVLASISGALPLLLNVETVSHKKFNTIHLGKAEYTLTDFQKSLWSDLAGNQYLSVTAPTSAGKSFILRNYMINNYLGRNNFIGVLIIPTKSLLAESFQAIMSVYKAMAGQEDIDGLNIYQTSAYVENFEDKRAVFVLTPERFLSLLSNKPKDFHIDLLIVDEAQLVSDATRGARLKLGMQKYIQAYPGSQIFMGSPMLTNQKSFDRIFGLQNVSPKHTEHSPVSQNIIRFTRKKGKPKTYHVRAYFGETSTIDDNNADLIIEKTFDDIPKLTSKQKAIALPYFAFKFGRFAPTLVYTDSPSKCIDVSDKLSGYISQESGEIKDEEIDEFIEFIRSNVHPLFSLVRTLKYGVASHYGSLPSNITRRLEGLFKTRKVNYIVSTSTLLHGINLPAKNLFLCYPSVSNGKELEKVEFWNLAGRAGRLGEDFEGNIYTIESSYNDPWVDKYLAEGVTKKSTLSSPIKNFFEDDQNNYSDLTDVLDFFIRTNKLKTLDNADKVDPISSITALMYNQFVQGKLKKQLEIDCADCLSQEQMQELHDKFFIIHERLENTPKLREVLEKYSIFSPIQVQSLYTAIESQLEESLFPDDLLPRLSSSFFWNVYILLKEHLCFGARIEKRPPAHQDWLPLNKLSFDWATGKKYSEIISKNLSGISRDDAKGVNQRIKYIFSTLDQVVSYKFATLMGCYIEILRFFQESGKYPQLASKSLVPVDTYLELGASKKTEILLMTLGVSRMSSLALSEEKELVLLEKKENISNDDIKSAVKIICADNKRANRINSVILDEAKSII